MNRRNWLQSTLAFFGAVVFKTTPNSTHQNIWEKCLLRNPKWVQIRSNVVYMGQAIHKLITKESMVCFTPKQQVLTTNGWVQAKDIKKGDFVHMAYIIGDGTTRRKHVKQS